MPWIERFGNLAAETGLSLYVETTNRAPGNDDWSKMKKNMLIRYLKSTLKIYKIISR